MEEEEMTSCSKSSFERVKLMKEREMMMQRTRFGDIEAIEWMKEKYHTKITVCTSGG